MPRSLPSRSSSPLSPPLSLPFRAAVAGLVLVALALTAVAPGVAAAAGELGGTTLYAVDLDGGEFSRVGEVGDGETVVALALAGEASAYAATADGRLVSFDPSDPGTLSGDVALSGLGGQTVVGLDVRPATDELFALGSGSTIFVVDADSGQATAIADGAFDPALEGGAFGFDFNPTVDRIRVVSETGQNLRLNPETGLIGSNPDTGAPTVDSRLAYADGDANAGAAPAAVGAGYTNSVADAESTKLYVIDAAQDTLALQDPPNEGVLNTVGALGVDVAGAVGFDILASGTAYATVATAVQMPNTGTGSTLAAGSAGTGPLAVLALAMVAALAGIATTRRLGRA